MKDIRELEKLKELYNDVLIPLKGIEEMKNAIEQGKKDRTHRKKILIIKRVGAGIAAAILILIMLPNMSADIAMAMEKIPIIGSLVRVVTFGRYEFADENHEAKVEIPKVEMDENMADTEQSPAKENIDSLNKDIEDYINPIVEEFKNTLSEEDKKLLEVTYEVVTDTDKWFTLRIDALEIQASAYQYNVYYHIDKLTGQRMSLKDIFVADSDYMGVISKEIQRQMREQMQADEAMMYFIDDENMPDTNFETIKENENFYFNQEGELVIVFDEFQVAPGYMGIPQFVIGADVLEGIRK